jgi:hypothetical protein
MNGTKWIIAPMFILAAVYDGLLGLLFLIAPNVPYDMFDVAPPNHWGYVQFPAALLVIFAIMFGQIALHPVANRSLIVYGMLLKVAYCGVAAWHWFHGDIPNMWKPLVIADLVFLLLFACAYVVLGQLRPAQSTADA